RQTLFGALAGSQDSVPEDGLAWVECTAERLLIGAFPIDGNWPRWYGHRPRSGLACRMEIGRALQARRASMCQSGVAKPPLEERRSLCFVARSSIPEGWRSPCHLDPK